MHIILYVQEWLLIESVFPKANSRVNKKLKWKLCINFLEYSQTDCSAEETAGVLTATDVVWKRACANC